MNTALDDRMRDLYARADDDIAAHRPICINRGACCKFGQFGHRLYVTEVELEYFATHEPAPSREVLKRDDACPYQVDGMCMARDHRPLGCRVFFCDPAARDWQGPLYERYLAELKQAGSDLGIDYRYGEWLAGLRRHFPLTFTHPID